MSRPCLRGKVNRWARRPSRQDIKRRQRSSTCTAPGMPLVRDASPPKDRRAQTVVIMNWPRSCSRGRGCDRALTGESGGCSGTQAGSIVLERTVRILSVGQAGTTVKATVKCDATSSQVNVHAGFGLLEMIDWDLTNSGHYKNVIPHLLPLGALPAR